ncbi:MAG TPA: ABC transporter permease [Candidatus Dormibacteraeota bacterium]|nr:ABC transporter permease [Candidatus Dormibacteraeota bacterium]
MKRTFATAFARFLILRDLAIQLVIREIRLRYRRTAIGVLWLFVFPLVQIVVLNFIFTVVLPTRVERYPIFVAIGVLVWTWFQTSLTLAATAITGNRELVRRPGLPVAILPITSVATNMVLLVAAAPAIALLLWYTGGGIGSDVLLIPIAIVIQFVLTVGLAYIVAGLNVSFRDTQNLVPLFLLLLFFVSPIFYDVTNVPERYRAVYDLNPFVILLNAYRAPFVGTGQPGLAPLGELAVLAVAVAMLGHLMFRRASRRFADEI